MLHSEIDKLLEYANEMLTHAEHEAERSEEDVVTHLICVNARQSIANFMAGFLVKRDIDIDRPVTLQGLLDQCREVDARFETIDLSPVHCRCETHDNDYCLQHDQVDACMEIAQKTRTIVMSQTPGY